MKTLLDVLGSLLLVLALVPLASAGGKHYVCPPCGMPCDADVFDAPGACPKCGAALIDEDEAKAQLAARKTVGILIFNGVQIIDYTGPYEIFQSAGFDVYTVAETKDPITTVAGMTVVPKYALADAPQPDIPVVPGGSINGPMDSAATLKWVKETAAKTRFTMSVCNGAFILAKAGLLDGLTATTTHGLITQLRAEYPKTKVVYDQRFVDNGKIVTAGGLTAGIDTALHVVSKTLGRGTAQRTALGEEYDWHEKNGFVRGLLADANLLPWIDTSIDGTGTWDLIRTEGGTDRWDVEARGTSKLSAAELVDRFGKSCTTEGGWKAATSAGSTPAGSGRWTFSGRDGKPWTGTLRVEAIDGTAGTYNLKLTIARAS